MNNRKKPQNTLEEKPVQFKGGKMTNKVLSPGVNRKKQKKKIKKLEKY